MQVLASVTEALAHDSSEVRAAACIFLKNVSRSVKVRRMKQIKYFYLVSYLLEIADKSLFRV